MENEIITYKEENKRLKEYFKKQREKNETMMKEEKVKFALSLENQIQKFNKVDENKVRQVRAQAQSDNLKLSKINNDLENDLNDLRVNIELIKSKKFNEMQLVKEKLQAIRNDNEVMIAIP